MTSLFTLTGMAAVGGIAEVNLRLPCFVSLSQVLQQLAALLNPPCDRPVLPSQVAQQLVERTRLLKWLLARIRPREFDSNKQQASDLLAILVQVRRDLGAGSNW